jgi:dihydrofolate reductase
MRKIIFQMMTTVDGYFEGPDKELDWHVVDDDLFQNAIDLLNSADTLLFGRVTYQMMAAYWPTVAAVSTDPVIAERTNNLPKVVFSTTLKTVDWQNSRLVKEHSTEEIKKLKQQPGKNMVIFGSSDLAVALTKEGLIDEYRIIVNPVVLGGGKTLLEGLDERLMLKLVEAKTFSSGTVLLSMRPEVGEARATS